MSLPPSIAVFVLTLIVICITLPIALLVRRRVRDMPVPDTMIVTYLRRIGMWTTCIGIIFFFAYVPIINSGATYFECGQSNSANGAPLGWLWVGVWMLCVV